MHADDIPENIRGSTGNSQFGRGTWSSRNSAVPRRRLSPSGFDPDPIRHEGPAPAFRRPAARIPRIDPRQCDALDIPRHQPDRIDFQHHLRPRPARSALPIEPANGRPIRSLSQMVETWWKFHAPVFSPIVVRREASSEFAAIMRPPRC